MNICELCTQPYDPPVNRPSWARCIACTMTPQHANHKRFGAAPAYAMPRPTLEELTFIVPGPPMSKNRAHGATYDADRKRLRVFVNHAARKYQDAVATHAVNALGPMIYRWRDEPRFSTGRFHVHTMSYFDRESADAANPVELVLDALQGTLYANDKQCVGSYDKALDKTAPRLVVTVKFVPGPPQEITG